MGERVNLEGLFRSEDEARDTFLSRLFGIFNEEIVRIWCRDDRATYVDMGRPTIRTGSSTRGSTLDFTLQHRETGRAFVTEMKCELQYERYKYLTLTDPAQLVHHKKKAFSDFLTATRHPSQVSVTIGPPNDRRQIEVDGGVLVWGRVSVEGRKSAMRQYGLADVISLEEVINDLIEWNNEEYHYCIDKWRLWCDSMFEGLRRVQ